MAAPRQRGARLAALGALSAYSALLLFSSWPSALLNVPGLNQAKQLSSRLLHEAGTAGGIEVFNGMSAPRAVHHMSCFRVTAEGEQNIVLYDDLSRCQAQKHSPIRDQFQVFQMKNLAAGMSHVDLGGPLDFGRHPTNQLFLFSEYYCHHPEASDNGTTSVLIESLYVGVNLDSKDFGDTRMAGRRDCRTVSWRVVSP